MPALPNTAIAYLAARLIERPDGTYPINDYPAGVTTALAEAVALAQAVDQE